MYEITLHVAQIVNTEQLRRHCPCSMVCFRYITPTTTTTAIELSPGGSSPYTGTDKTNKNKIYINGLIY